MSVIITIKFIHTKNMSQVCIKLLRTSLDHFEIHILCIPISILQILKYQMLHYAMICFFGNGNQSTSVELAKNRSSENVSHLTNTPLWELCCLLSCWIVHTLGKKIENQCKYVANFYEYLKSYRFWLRMLHSKKSKNKK